MAKFQKGNRLGGRKKGFAGMCRDIRERTGGGKALVDFAMEVFEDKDDKYFWQQRWEAMLFLTRYGFGQPVTNIQIDAMVETETKTSPTIDLRALTSEQRARFREALLIATGGDDRPLALKLMDDRKPVIDVDGGE